MRKIRALKKHFPIFRLQKRSTWLFQASIFMTCFFMIQKKFFWKIFLKNLFFAQKPNQPSSSLTPPFIRPSPRHPRSPIPVQPLLYPQPHFTHPMIGWTRLSQAISTSTTPNLTTNSPQTITRDQRLRPTSSWESHNPRGGETQAVPKACGDFFTGPDVEMCWLCGF